MAGESLPGDTGPEIDAFLKRTLQSISLKCDVDPILFTARCQGIAGSDVEIRLAPRGYEVMFYTGLLTDPEQTQLTIDYVANWVKENPLKIEPLKVKRVGAQTLAPGNVFAFLFIPASRPLPSDADIEFMERQIAPVRLPGRFGWLICSQPYDETSANKPFVAETIQAWFAEQSDGDSILVAPTPVETKVLRAAVRAATATNSVIGSHTVRGRVVRDQLDIVEAAGGAPDRFIWIHTQAEPDEALHLEVARRGAWIEYDAIGSDDFDDAIFVERIRRVLDAGLGGRLLLSQDRGMYDPAQPGGGTPRPYTYLSETFLPKLRSSGVDEATIEQLTRANPFAAFAR